MLPIAMLTVKYFNEGQPSPYFEYFRHFGPTPAEMARNFGDHSFRFLGELFHPGSLLLTAALMLVYCLLPFLAPETILLALPMLIVNFMGGRSGMHTYEEYYFAFVTPFFYLGAIKGFQRVQKWGWFPRWLVLLNLPVWALSGILMGPLVRPVDSIYVAMPPIAALDECSEAGNLVPAESSASVVMALGPHLSHRTQLYLFPNPFVVCAYGGTRQAIQQIESINQTPLPRNLPEAIEFGSGKAEYVVLCPKSSPFPLSDMNQSSLIVGLLQSRIYETIYLGHYVMALRRLPTGSKPMLRLLARRTGKPADTPKQIIMVGRI